MQALTGDFAGVKTAEEYGAAMLGQLRQAQANIRVRRTEPSLAQVQAVFDAGRVCGLRMCDKHVVCTTVSVRELKPAVYTEHGMC